MAHSKSFMLDAMREQAAKIMDLLTAEGVAIKPDHLTIPENAEKLRADFLRPGFHWLYEIHDNEYDAVIQIKKLLKPEIWQRYKEWGGFDEHREMILLRERLSDLRKRLVSRDRPDFFKKTVIAKALKRAEKKNKKSS